MKNISKILLGIIVFNCAFSSLDEKRTPEKMVLVEGGYALMGAESGALTQQDDAKPVHFVQLDHYYMDKYEVSVADYRQCVDAGKCAAPTETSSKTRENYYNNSYFDRFPVVNITWQDAANYCAFVDKRLPTEAEWEFAARGGRDDRIYPWGNVKPTLPYVNVTKIPGDTELPNTYPEGTSLTGIADTLGNVSEWVADWYDEAYYASATEMENPQGPASGTERVIRGDNFETLPADMSILNRYHADPTSHSFSVGFRCAKDVRESLNYDTPESDASAIPYERMYVKAGNDNGIFLLKDPGSGYNNTFIAVIPNGAVVEVLGGPVLINYTNWYRIRTQDGYTGWTIASALASPGSADGE